MADSLPQLHQQAIQAALTARWEDALKLNQLIIEEEPQSVDALNRLARAYFEVGNLKESKKYYESSLKVDPYNQIAAKFLKRIESCSKKGTNGEKQRSHSSGVSFSLDSFIEEPGKTKVVPLIKVAEPQRLSVLSPGEVVKLVARSRGVVVNDMENNYLGALPDDIGHRLLRFLRGGNKYQVLIKNVKINGLAVLIRETFRSARFKNQPSFLDNLAGNMAYSSDHIVMPDETQGPKRKRLKRLYKQLFKL
jgi:tetratricopeptide (TPR) repeat protein